MTSYLHELLKTKLASDEVFKSQVKTYTSLYEQNEKIFSAGEKYPYFCMLEEGGARVKVKNGANNINNVGTIVAELENEDIFGEFGLFDESPIAVDIIASVPSKIIQIDNQSFLDFLEQDPKFAYTFSLKVMQNLFKRVRNQNQAISKLTHFNLELQKHLKSLN